MLLIQIRSPASAGRAFPSSDSLGMTVGMDRAATLPPGGSGRDLAQLFPAMASGDEAALRTLYSRTSGKLFGIIVRILGSTADAEDVLQEVFVAAWHNAGRYDERRASPISWLCVMARNRAIDRLRTRKLDVAPIEAADNVADTRP